MNRRKLIGADEAGYGPNLGPLVVAATSWLIPAEMTTEEFSRSLSVCLRPAAWRPDCGHVPLGDSKDLFQPAVGLATLEAGLLALLSLCESVSCVTTVQSMLEQVRFAKSPPEAPTCHLPWYAELHRFPVPVCHSRGEIERLGKLVGKSLASNDIQLKSVAAMVITETEFNRAVQLTGSKGQLLSLSTLRLVDSLLMDECSSAEIFCDRQGGRTNYLPVLLDALPDQWFVETTRSRERCSYRNTSVPERTIHFTVGGDRFAPTGLASMLAKYLRERLMESFNQFWRLHLPELKPTAGYPVDARRFVAEIAEICQRLQLPLSDWWRIK